MEGKEENLWLYFILEKKFPFLFTQMEIDYPIRDVKKQLFSTDRCNKNS